LPLEFGRHTEHPNSNIFSPVNQPNLRSEQNHNYYHEAVAQIKLKN